MKATTLPQAAWYVVLIMMEVPPICVGTKY